MRLIVSTALGATGLAVETGAEEPDCIALTCRDGPAARRDGEKDGTQWSLTPW